MVALPVQKEAFEPGGQTVSRQQEQVAEQVETPVSKVSKTDVKDVKIDQKPPETVSVMPEKRTKESLKKRTFRPYRAIETAVTEIEKGVEKSKSNLVAEAIERLRHKDGETETVDHQKQSAIEHGSDIPDGSAAADRRSLREIDIYKLAIRHQIQKNWAFSERLVGDCTNLKAVLMIKIMPNGEIGDIWFERRSGNSHFDESTYRAVKRANPLPPLPERFLHNFYNVGLIFTPSGLI